MKTTITTTYTPASVETISTYIRTYRLADVNPLAAELSGDHLLAELAHSFQTKEAEPEA